MLKMPYAGCPGPSPAISAQFTLKMCVAAGNSKKFTKSPYFGGSRSFKVIDVDTNKKLVTSDGDDGDEGRINFSVALSPKTKRTRNNKLKQ